MAPKPSLRPARALMADVAPEERRSWLSSGIAAFAVAALGLVVAGSVSLSSAEHTAATSDLPVTRPTAVAAPVPGAPAVKVPTASPPTSGPLRAFAARRAAGQSSRDQVRVAITKERAAQRAEVLSETAEDVSRAARNASTRAREKDLAATDRATRENAVKLAQQRLRDAVAARLAAQAERQQAETTPPADRATDGTTDGAAVAPTAPDIPSGGGSASPVPGAVIGAHFGQYGLWSRYHTGLDFRASYGTPIKAVTTGVVVFAGNSGDWSGNHVAIRHAGGYTSMSSHMSSMAVHTGESVSAGQVIGYVGQTGRAFGAHLHFEIYPPGVRYGDVYKAIDPVPWLRQQGVSTN